MAVLSDFQQKVLFMSNVHENKKVEERPAPTTGQTIRKPDKKRRYATQYGNSYQAIIIIIMFTRRLLLIGKFWL